MTIGDRELRGKISKLTSMLWMSNWLGFLRLSECVGEEARDPGCDVEVRYFLIMCSTVAPGMLRFLGSGVGGSAALLLDAEGQSASVRSYKLS